MAVSALCILLRSLPYLTVVPLCILGQSPLLALRCIPVRPAAMAARLSPPVDAPPPANDAELALRLQLEEAGAGTLDAAAVATLTAFTADADFATALALTEAGLSHVAVDGAPAPRRLDLPDDGRGGGGGSGGAGESSSAARGARSVMVSCGICLERVAATAMTPCGGRGCGHAFCTPCLRSHVASRVTERRYPVCAAGGCGSPMPYEVAAVLVAGTGDTEATLTRLHIEACFMPAQAFCANEACATPFDFTVGHALDIGDGRGYNDGDGGGAGAVARGGQRVELGRGGLLGGGGRGSGGATAGAPGTPEHPTAYKVTCPLCRKDTCVRCCCLWHQRSTCAAYQAERESTDALRVLAKRRKWRACPGCGVLIDKVAGDCNFLRHTACGTGFCFSCGVPYASLKPTRENQHGRAACRCGLWEASPG